MSDQSLDRDDAQLASALRSGLAMRDRSAPPPRFTAVWPRSRATSSPEIAWRPALAAIAAVVIVAGLSWSWINRSGALHSSPLEARVDASLARELSSPDYWRVPTDELLAFAAPRLSVDLPSPTGFHVSLEESLL